ncbi:bifunctional GNAT family N-acetyltransferase/acetate--CoA ligase family protein [uncultured Nocardioides sp.]|uniref:bifunctional acetate--CoA ligase family protein/GNAT family N-acetyltransferase n=1 Tax=uncultured Nocardioides sp. TaxID=198441 RepID=UPI00262552F2|nr:bifunctional GNAT family N-acetyltransferase/acetate--CoA ligase family protein [uncultured Nocardioides sp.]
MTMWRSPGPADVLLADGSIAVIRPLRGEDADALHDLHEQVSDDAIRMRFFSVSRHAAHAYADHVLAHPEHLALVAERHGRLVGLATAEPMSPDRAEIAFLVADDTRGHGVGTLLLEHLAALALERGITQLEADVLSENHAMLSVITGAGYARERTFEPGTVVITLGTGATVESTDQADLRDFRAEARSLDPMLHPRSVAVVGARADGTGIGATVLRSIVTGGFAGRIVAVHPRAEELAGVPTYHSLHDIPDGLDLVVICVPAALALDVFRDAVATGVRAAVIVSSGFGELGADGARMQHDLVSLARAHDVRIVGPNCLGLLLNHPDLRLNATFNEAVPPSGGLAVASQSGGVGIVLMDLARELGLGVHTFVSLGNKADVSSNDLLAAWYDDPEITAAALYLESFGNSAKFARFARRFARRKPLLAVVGGRSAGGSRAGASHTAAAATPAVGVDALFAQAGVIGCRDAEDLARTAVLLTQQPLPAGRRVAIVSNAGGMGVLAADAAADEGLEVPEFSAGLQARLAELVNGTTGTTNPVDAGAGVPPEQFAALLDAVLASGEVDAVLVLPVATGVTDGRATMPELVRARAAHPGLPVLGVPLGGLPDAGPSDTPITTYRTTASALRALGRAVRYAAWLADLGPAPEPTDPAGVVAARAGAHELLGPADSRWLSASEASGLLALYGVGLLGCTAHSATEAVHGAVRAGLPVAVKVTDPGIVHKTELGLVRTGLRTREQVRDAYRDFRAAVGHAPEVLVQPMVSGTEVALGVVRDPSMGPLVMVASGGVTTDVWDDRAFLVPPVSASEAERAIGSLRIARLLAGFRGAPAGDVAGLVELVVRLGRLATDVPEVAELDLNPVLIDASGCVVVDAKVRLAIPVGPDGSAPRQLRPVT